MGYDIAEAIYNRDKGICGICGLPVNPDKFHIDHIIPVSRGGENVLENLQVAHPKCNQVKGNRDFFHPGNGPKRTLIVLRISPETKQALKDRAMDLRLRGMSELVKMLIDVELTLPTTTQQ